MRILNAGCWEDKIGTDFIDLHSPLDRNDVKECDLDKDKIPFPDGTFDLILCWQVFAHLNYPLHALKEFNRVLKKNGKIKFDLPNKQFIYRNTDNFSQKWNIKNENVIYNLYTLDEITELLIFSGFETLDFIKYGFRGYDKNIELKLYKFAFETAASFISEEYFSPQILIESRKI